MIFCVHPSLIFLLSRRDQIEWTWYDRTGIDKVITGNVLYNSKIIIDVGYIYLTSWWTILIPW